MMYVCTRISSFLFLNGLLALAWTKQTKEQRKQMVAPSYFHVPQTTNKEKEEEEEVQSCFLFQLGILHSGRCSHTFLLLEIQEKKKWSSVARRCPLSIVPGTTKKENRNAPPSRRSSLDDSLPSNHHQKQSDHMCKPH